MKLKVSLDKNTIQTFFREHVEKVVLGLVVVCCAVIVIGAFGGDRLKLKNDAKELGDRAKNARQHWEQTLPKDDALQHDEYASTAVQSQDSIKEKYYKHSYAWDRPLFPQRRKRKDPKLFNVEELRAEFGRGPFTAQAGAAGTTPGSDTKGYRWAMLTGAVPLKKQTEAFHTAFQDAQFVDPQADAPKYRRFYVQRAEVQTGREKDEELDWQDIDVLKARKNLAAIGNPVQDSLEDKYRPAAICWPLPPLAGGRSWGPEVLHERLVGPSLERVRQNPRNYTDERVTWPGEAMLNPINSEKTQILFFLRAAGPATEREYFAVEFDSPQAAAQFGRTGNVTGKVTGKKISVLVPAVDPRTRRPGTRPEYVPLLKYDSPQPLVAPGPGGVEPGIDPDTGEPLPVARVTSEAAREDTVACLLFRFIDLLKADAIGKKYRYRVMLELKNPNYQVEARYLENPLSREDAWVRPKGPKTDQPDKLAEVWSAQSNMVEVLPDMHLLALSVTAPANPLKADPWGRMMVVKWVDTTGMEAHKKFPCYRGTPADFENCRFPEDEPAVKPPPKKVKGKPDILPGAGETGRSKSAVSFSVDYVTNAVVLDIHGGERISTRDRNLTAPGEILVWHEEEKRLRVYNELADLQEYRERTTEGKPGGEGLPGPGPAHPSPPGLEGGLEGFR